MAICDFCKKGQYEMCEYFKEHYLEDGGPVKDCPEFEEDEGEVNV